MSALKRTAVFARPYAWVSFFMVITVILPVAMELAVPLALGYVIDQGIVPGDWEVIVRGTVFLMVVALAGALATLGQGVCRALLSQGLAYDMRNKLFSHIQSLSFANLDHLHTGQLMTRLSSDVDLVRMFIGGGLALLLRAVLMIAGSVVTMFIIDWQLAMIMALLLPLAILLLWITLRVATPLFTVVQEKLSALNRLVQENLAGVEVVKAFVREGYEIGRFSEVNQNYRDEYIKVGRLVAVTVPVLTLLTNLGMVAVIWFGGISTIGGRISVGELVAFVNYLLIGMAPMMLLSHIMSMVSQAEASAVRVWEVLDSQPVVTEAAQPQAPSSMAGNVVFRDVYFHYDGGSQGGWRENSQADREHRGGRDVLNGLNFEVKSGQRVALLGATGSGKSTLVNMIPRFYDVDSGQIYVDGIDVRDWRFDTLREGIGVVLQQTTLFNGTVRENIAFGQPGAAFDDVVAAAEAAEAHEFITALPFGYDSQIEEKGVNLSGGQKQRIAIARALLIQPKILILDDSTSAVDLTTEAKIQRALSRLMAGRTTFIVAQRINSVLNADKILILDNGRIVGQGTHAELLRTSEVYQEIYYSQLGGGVEVRDEQ